MGRAKRWLPALIGILAAALVGCGQNIEEAAGRIAFETETASPSDIMIMNGDGTEPQFVISNGSEPSLRSDGRLIALIIENNVYTVRTTGTGLFKVTDFGIGVGVRNPAINPSGDRIAYVSEVTTLGAVPVIHIIGTDGTGDRELVTSGTEPAWSPDSLQIAFVRDPDIYTINLDGTNLTNQTNNGTGVISTAPAFEPSGIRIAYTETPVVPSPIPSIRIVDLMSTEKTTLVVNGSHPTYRPDGMRFAFVRSGDIFSAKFDGTDVVQLTSGIADDKHPSWGFRPSD